MVLGVMEGQIRGGYFPDSILDPSVIDRRPGRPGRLGTTQWVAKVELVGLVAKVARVDMVD